MGAPASCVNFLFVDLQAHTFDLMILWLEAFLFRILPSGCKAFRLFGILQDRLIDLLEERKLIYVHLLL